MSLGMMSVYHPKWREFYDRMEGPEGCNFREPKPGDYRWDCDNGPQRPIARRILAAMGATPVEIEQSMGYFVAGGGMCDCEIVFNVYSSLRPRPIRRRKPRR